MTNILFLDQFNSFGGAQHCLADLLPGIAQRGWGAHVAIPYAGPGGGSLELQLRASGFPVHTISCGAYQSTRKTLADFGRFAMETPVLVRQIGNLVSSHQIRLLYVNGPRLLPSAAVVAKRRNIPLIFHCHVHLGQSAAIRLAGWALRHSKATVIGCCEYAAEPLRSYIPPGKLHIVYNGTADFGGAAHDGIRRIGVLGRIEQDKGQMEFVQAARILNDQNPDLKFLIAGAPLFSGEDYLNRVRSESRNLPIEFLGWQSDIHKVFASMDLLVVPSASHDPNPRVVLESFSARVPVVAFPAGGIPEILTDGTSGFLTAKANPVALAERIRDVLQMGDGERNRVVTQARAAWEQKHTIDRYRDGISAKIAQALA